MVFPSFRRVPSLRLAAPFAILEFAGHQAHTQESFPSTPSIYLTMGKSELTAPIYFSHVDFRVGKIIDVSMHPTSDAFYIERVEVGNGEVLEMVMEHQKFLTPEELLNKKVIALCNMKAVKIGKVKSTGLLMSVKSERGAIELVEPAPEAQVGERVYADGERVAPDAPAVIEPLTPLQQRKLKAWEHLAPEIKTNKKTELIFKEFYPLRTKSGPLHVETLKQAAIA